MDRRLQCFRRMKMFTHLLHDGGEIDQTTPRLRARRADTSAVGTIHWPLRGMLLVALVVLSLFLAACENGPSAPQGNGTTTTTGGPSFPTTPLQLRTPSFGSGEQIAPTVKVLSSADPTLIV